MATPPLPRPLPRRPRAGAPLGGIGELFGESVDAVIRRPAPAAVPLLVDAAAFLALLLVVEAVGLGADRLPYDRAAFGFGITSALPSLADTLDLAAAARALVGGGIGYVAIALAVLVPVAAFAEAGFVAVLKSAYLDREHRPLLEVFLPAAKARFLPMLLYRAVLAAAFLLALVLATQGGVFRNSAAGALMLRFLLLFAPYAIVVDGAPFLEGVKRSLAAVGDHLATSLVLLLFLLLVSGGVAAVLAPFVHAFGPVAILLGILVYAPVGTALATFVLLVWTSFRPEAAGIDGAPAPSAAAEPA